MTFWQASALFIGCSIGLCSNAMANLSFDGTLVEPPPCTINSGSTIETDFKDVGVNKVDGSHYRSPIDYTITCLPGTLPWEMVLTVRGAATSFDSSALQSSVSDLGIRILQNGMPFTLNTLQVINPATPPVLEAVPVKRAGVSLSTGAFSASATLLAEYQ